MSSIEDHKTSFAGYPVEIWNEYAEDDEEGKAQGPLKDPSTTAYRLAIDFNDVDRNDEETLWPWKLRAFLSLPNVDQVPALISGVICGDDSVTQTFVERLVMYRERLPNLRAIFIGDGTREECEISWLQHADLSSLFLAFPQLEHFGVRGVINLRFGRLDHATLKSFALESGGTPTHLIDEIKAAHLPALVDFELWTGDSSYGWDGTLEDLRPILMGQTFPHLTRLGICNSDITNEVVMTLIESPLYGQLEHLDLSGGTLNDEGACPLLNHPHTQHLTSLDVRHHFCSAEVQAELSALKDHGVRVEIDEAMQYWGGSDERYVAVGE